MPEVLGKDFVGEEEQVLHNEALIVGVPTDNVLKVSALSFGRSYLQNFKRLEQKGSNSLTGTTSRLRFDLFVAHRQWWK